MRDFNRTSDAARPGLVFLLPLLLACEESLPPRIHPLDIDPKGFLEQSFSMESGVVMYEPYDSVSQSLAGTLYLDIRNIHDEVLSGREDITITVEYWFPDFPGDTIRVLGDRNNLVNPFNFQGDVFMLDGDILTIHPDSSARFQILFDHTAEALWDYGDPVYVKDSCFHPPCAERITTDVIQMSARASVRLFENQKIALATEEAEFTVWYFFKVISRATIELEEFRGWVDSSGATVRWVGFHQSGIYQYSVQRSPTFTGGFTTIPNSMITPEGVWADTVAYHFTEPTPPSGTWYYRVVVFEDFFLIGPLYVRSIGTVRLVVP